MRFRKYTSHWRVYFAIRPVLEFITFVPNIPLIEVLSCGVLLLIVTLRDLRRQQRRYPWPHWVGIALHFVSLAIALLALTIR